MAQRIEEYIKIKVQRIRMDNAGENKMLVKSCDQNEMGIKFEYTAPGTPQQNGGRAMMNHAGFTVKKRQEMWCDRSTNSYHAGQCSGTRKKR